MGADPRDFNLKIRRDDPKRSSCQFSQGLKFDFLKFNQRAERAFEWSEGHQTGADDRRANNTKAHFAMDTTPRESVTAS